MQNFSAWLKTHSCKCSDFKNSNFSLNFTNGKMKKKKQIRYAQGQAVTYVPNHATGPDDPICEHGEVSTVKDNPDGTQQVWVKYTGSTGQLTPTKNLIPS